MIPPFLIELFVKLCQGFAFLVVVHFGVSAFEEAAVWVEVFDLFGADVVPVLQGGYCFLGV